MRFKYIIWILLFYSINGYSKSKFILEGIVTNFKDNLTCVILNYKDGIETKLTKIENSNGMISYFFDDKTEEGVFRIILFDKIKSKSFDIILSSDENIIRFTYNFSDDDSLPSFQLSECNKRWYSFIKFDIENKKNIKELKNYQKSSSTYQNISFEDSSSAIKKLEDEYTKIKNEFITTAKNNKYAILMVKSRKFNDFNFNIESDLYIDLDELIINSKNNNNKFLSTPLFKDFFQFYAIKLDLNWNNIEERKKNIKKAFCNVIDKFSENSLARKCAIRYVIFALREMNDEDIANYFSVKYNYKM